tara:strand:+ start:244 stop:615 length:372 start_codon:yes stop_codon:yes gene_type:complete
MVISRSSMRRQISKPPAKKRKRRDPKVGTGKKPKGSGRRLYTDENPKDTVSIKFATPADARATVAKVKRIKKPYARKIQILTVMEQRAKVMGKGTVVDIAEKAKKSLKARHEKSKKSKKSKKT